MGHSLDRFIPELNQNISRNLATPLKVYNWSSSSEGLHRTLSKLKSLSKWPKIIVYHGGSQEFLEQKFNLKDSNKIVYNFKKYQDAKILSAIIIFPFLSKVFYSPTEYVTLSKEVKPHDWLLTGSENQNLLEIGFRLYEFEIEELVRLSIEHGSNLIIVTPPINFEQSPKRICDNSISSSILEKQDAIQKLIENGDSKEAYQEAYMLSQESVGNAKTFYQLGFAAKLSGDFEKSRKYLIMASAFDCHPAKTHVAINAIQKNVANKHHLFLLDFDQLVAQNYGRNILFDDEIHPQQIYYELLLEDMTSIITKLLKI